MSENLLEKLGLNCNKEIRKLNLDQPEMFGAYVKKQRRPQSAGGKEADRFNQIKFLMHLKENGQELKLNSNDEQMIRRKIQGDFSVADVHCQH